MTVKATFLGLVLLSVAGCSQVSVVRPDRIIDGAHSGGTVVSIAAKGGLGVSGGLDGRIKVWSLRDGSQKAGWQGHDGEVTGVYFVAPEQVIISSGYDGRIVIWDPSGRRLKQVDTGSPVTALAAAPQAGTLISGHKDGRVIRWDSNGLEVIGQERLHTDWVRAVAFSAAAGLAASSGADGAVYLWHTGARPERLAQLWSDIRALAFAPDGRRLYGGTWFSVYRWDLDALSAVRLDTEHRGIIKDLKVSPDGSALLTISRQTDSTVLALDPSTGGTLRNFGRHELCGAAVDISPGGDYLMTTSDDGSVRIWWLGDSLGARR